MRETLRSLLADHPDIEVVGEAADWRYGPSSGGGASAVPVAVLSLAWFYTNLTISV